MQPLVIEASDITGWLNRLWWPVLRVGGFVASAPIISERFVPGRVKIVFALGLTLLLAPLARAPVDLSIFSGNGVFIAVKEMVIGISIGMVVQLAFEALTLAGQTIAATMGLGFATLIDPQRGANTAVIGQLFMSYAILAYLGINGHLMLLGALANSFETLPIAAAGFDRGFVEAVALWGGRVFETGLLIALPAVVALVIVNLALGVVSRAAPQMNLFGIGFPITLMAGFFVLLAGMDGLMNGILVLIRGALTAVVDLTASAPGTVP
jgi:flagellar biosynthetic protein FliR